MNPTLKIQPGTVASPKSSVPDDPRIVQALEEYATALKAGPRPDRCAFLAKYPDLAAALGECLDGLEFVQMAAPLLHEAVPASPDATTDQLHPEGPLGDYRLVREIGRGGMGVVYEAVQISLGRRVALKVLPFAAALDGKQLQRFKNEAQAASHLHHQNIVPVYGVGCDRGVHHYSMQFIDGKTLSALIQELRQPVGPTAAPRVEPTGLYTPGSEGPADQTTTPPVAAISTERSANTPAMFRTLAKLGVQAAEALEHAHAMGVIHRDIKPANLMVDQRGNLWITDFGLAHCQSQAGLTMTGDLVGTLRYMSPEQALAKRVLVDHRTDIYSLGATLYELLTLEPPFAGNDRQELLRQIAFEEPRPLRRLNRAIPAELETIVLKAIEKNPNDRYAGAQELADDLERFLRDEPIRAKRPSLLQRARKWSHRHQSVVVTAGLGVVALLLMAVAGLAINNSVIKGAKELTDTALLNETEAKAELKRALEREKLSTYFQRIGRADLEWWANNVNRADQILEECPLEYRANWEWRYLKRLCNSELITLRGHTDAVWCVAFSPDGRLVASASSDKTVKVWDLLTSKEVLTLREFEDANSSVAFSPAGRLLASAGSGQPGEVKIWDVKTGKELFSLAGHHTQVSGVAFSPDGQLLASAGWDWTVRLWDTTTGQEVRRLRHSSSLKCVAFSPDGTRIAAGEHNNLVTVWGVADGQKLLTLRGHRNDVLCVAFSPDGQRLVTGSWDRTVRVWDASNGQEIWSHDHGNIVNGTAFSPDGQSVASASSDGSVKVWSLNGQELLTLRGHSREVLGVAFSPGGRCLASGSYDHTVKIWDLTTSKQSRFFDPVGSRYPRAAFSPDGRCLASANRVDEIHTREDLRVRVIDVLTGRELRALAEEYPNGCNSVAFSADGKHLATDWGANVKTWNAETGHEVFTCAGHTADVTGVAFSSDHRFLASASADKTVRLWDAGTGHELRTLTGHSDVVTGNAFSAKGQFLASGSKDRTARIWNVSTGGEVFTLTGHLGSVTEVVFSPDGRRLASASKDQTVRIWDTSSGRLLHTLSGHTDAVTSISFSPDGQRLASTSEDGSVTVWDPATGQMALTLHRQLGRGSWVGFSPVGQRLLAAGKLMTLIPNRRPGFKVWDAEAASEEGPTARKEMLKVDAREAAYLRGRTQAALGQLDKAVAQYSQAIELGREDAEAWSARGNVYACLRQWEKAAADFSRAVQAKPDDPYLWHRHAMTKLAVDDLDGYRHVCAGMREKFAKTKDPATVCMLLLAHTVAEAGTATVDLDRWAKNVVQAPSDGPRTKGYALYRAGQYGAAVDFFQKLDKAKAFPLRGGDLCCLAMAQHRLGNEDEARATLVRASNWIVNSEQYFERGGYWAWSEQVEVRCLRREAEMLLKGN